MELWTERPDRGYEPLVEVEAAVRVLDEPPGPGERARLDRRLASGAVAMGGDAVVGVTFDARTDARGVRRLVARGTVVRWLGAAAEPTRPVPATRSRSAPAAPVPAAHAPEGAELLAELARSLGRAAAPHPAVRPVSRPAPRPASRPAPRPASRPAPAAVRPAPTHPATALAGRVVRREGGSPASPGGPLFTPVAATPARGCSLGCGAWLAILSALWFLNLFLNLARGCSPSP